MDWMKFLHIAVWTFAIGVTFITVLSLAFFAWREFSTEGRLDKALDALKGRVYSFRMSLLVYTVFAWIAVACLR